MHAYAPYLVPDLEMPGLHGLQTVPSDEVLRDFKLVGTVAEMRKLHGVRSADGTIDPAYAPLTDAGAQSVIAAAVALLMLLPSLRRTIPCARGTSSYAFGSKVGRALLPCLCIVRRASKMTYR